eukprot:CCRYP_011008-RA/>CCRYP_011008-RA protein AED:0.02 eAED:0.02 QI:670/1/1/1/1/1/2/198/387
MWAVRFLRFFTILSSSILCLAYGGYSDLTSSHHLKWNGKCTSVPAGFNYNYRKGKGYETNYESYFAFYTCKGWSCDRTVERAIRIDDYFRATSGCVQDYCDQCTDDSCSSNCITYASLATGNDTYDGCSATTSSEGLKYYYGPQCTHEGDVTMGYFFDKHCQLNATRRGNIYSPESFISFDVFRFVQSICTACSYFGVCEGIYNSSFACMGNNGTFLWAGDDIALVDDFNAYGGKRRTEEVEEYNDTYIYDDRGYEYDIEADEEQDEEQDTRAATFAFAEEVCMEVHTLEHTKDEMNRNITAQFLRETGVILVDMSIVACIGAVVVGVAFLFVAHTYYARHRARWSRERVESLNDHNNYSMDEFSLTSTDDGASLDDLSVPTPSMRR